MTLNINFYLENGLELKKGTVFTMSGQFERLSIKQWVLKFFGFNPIYTYKRFVVTKDCDSGDPFIPYKELKEKQYG